MSRPIKKGLSYFPLDTDILSDRKIRRLFQNYGCEGFSTYMAILCEAYGTTGYYVRYTDDFCFDIGFTLNLKEEQIREIIGFCVEIRLFNQELFALQGILTSFGIQSRYRVINKRSISRISPEWELREETAPISTVEISVPVTETPVLATETTPQALADMRKRYGDAQGFLSIFTPDLQIAAARHPERTYTGTAPTLATIAVGYGEPVAIVWICIQLENVNLFAGVKEKMPVSRQKELSVLILTEYPFLKASEMLLFFHRLKCGRYGRFYGSVDALTITTSLLQFMDERRKESVRYRQPDTAAPAITTPSSSGITYEEYLRLKEQKQQHHEHE